MSDKKLNQMTQELAKETLTDLLVALKFLEAAAPDLTMEGLKALLAVALTSWNKDSVSLPDVTKISKVLDKSPSRASRIIGSLSDPKGLSLVEARSGLSGTRSESLILTNQGKDLVSSFLEVLTRKQFEELSFQGFEELQAAKNSAQKSNRKAELYLKQTDYNKSTLTLTIGPKSDVMSEEVQKWCADSLSETPEMLSSDDQVLVSFSNISDAVYFKLRWCR